MKFGNVHTFWTILECLWIIDDVKGNYSMPMGFKKNYSYEEWNSKKTMLKVTCNEFFKPNSLFPAG